MFIVLMEIVLFRIQFLLCFGKKIDGNVTEYAHRSNNMCVTTAKNTIRKNSMRKKVKLQSRTGDILLVDFLVEH